MSWYLAVLKKYAVFSGRARRKEFWMFYLFQWIIFILAAIIDNVLGIAFKTQGISMGYGPFYLIIALAVFIPTIAVFVRRLHDIGKSGWWYFIALVPLVGIIWLIVLLATDSQAGPNQYGPNPKEVPAL